MKKQVTLIFITLFIFTSILLAQEKIVDKKDTLQTKTNSIKSTDGVTTAGDVIDFKNSTGNAIITITDEGSNVGSITLPSGAAPSTTTNKLYNEGGTLKFNGSDIGAGSGSSGGWTDLGTQIHNTTLTDKVGIGTNNPLSNLSVGGDGIATANIYSETSVSEGHAVHGISSDIKGIGVYGHATNSEQHNDWTTKNYGGFFQADGHWGIGVYGYGTGPNAKGIVGYSLNDIGIKGITESGTSSGIRGEATATGTGVNASGGYFEASGDLGYGVYGYATSTNSAAVNYGGYFKSDGGQGFGVYGDVNNGTGVHGEALNGTGVHGYTWASDGIGIHGEAPASGSSVTNYGGKFRSGGEIGIGVFGEATYSAGTTTNYGGKFIASGYSGGGVSGEATGYSGRGVFGLASNSGSGENYGGYFKAKGVAGKGVYGIATGTSGVGVYGDATNGAKAGYFNGNVTVIGTLSKGGGSFKIDHPLDPQNKFLYHSFVESPDMMNIYNGNITTDGNGNAKVELPDWFEALNKDFRYQLTVIGEFAQAIISEEINNNQFSIRTNKPNIKVSWEVTGIRHDAFANKNRIPVEEMKNSDEKGKYLHPEAFGQPKSTGIKTISNQ